jgi:hypothetical protein
VAAHLERRSAQTRNVMWITVSVSAMNGKVAVYLTVRSVDTPLVRADFANVAAKNAGRSRLTVRRSAQPRSVSPGLAVGPVDFTNVAADLEHG